jgi:hypothetical protein
MSAMDRQERIARAAAPQLQSGERIQVAVPAVQGNPLRGALLASIPIGAAVFWGFGYLDPGPLGSGLLAGAAVGAVALLGALLTPYRSLVVTDRRIVVFRSGIGTGPTEILTSVPRMVRLGPGRGLWRRPPQLPIALYVGRAYFPDLHMADAWAPMRVPPRSPAPLPVMTAPPVPEWRPPWPGAVPGPIAPVPPIPPRHSGTRVLVVAVAVLVGLPLVGLVVLVGAVVVVAATGSSAGSPGSASSTAAGPRRVELIQLENGDCFNSDVEVPPAGESSRIVTVETVVCSQPHNRQVVTGLAYPDTTWDGGGKATASEHCGLAFADDLRADIRNDSRYERVVIHTDLTRSGGARSLYVLCVIATDLPMTGSALA